jgi:Leucine-rich repeat (LRR) protein
LILTHNLLSGTIPSSIGTVANLFFLDLSTNDFNGTIPSELGLLSDLATLYLASNQFTGTIPTSLASLPNLGKPATQLISFSVQFCRYNWFSRVCLHAPHPTEYLALSDNNLTGSLDAFCGIDLEFFAANTCAQDEIECTCCYFTHCCDPNFESYKECTLLFQHED